MPAAVNNTHVDWTDAGGQTGY